MECHAAKCVDVPKRVPTGNVACPLCNKVCKSTRPSSLPSRQSLEGGWPPREGYGQKVRLRSYPHSYKTKGRTEASSKGHVHSSQSAQNTKSGTK